MSCWYGGGNNSNNDRTIEIWYQKKSGSIHWTYLQSKTQTRPLVWMADREKWQDTVFVWKILVLGSSWLLQSMPSGVRLVMRLPELVPGNFVNELVKYLDLRQFFATPTSRIRKPAETLHSSGNLVWASGAAKMPTINVDKAELYKALGQE